MEGPPTLFVPLNTLAQLPLSSIEDREKSYFSRHFLTYFWEQKWDLFWAPPPPNRWEEGPLILVPVHQAEAVLNGFYLTFPPVVVALLKEGIEQMLFQVRPGFETAMAISLGKCQGWKKVEAMRTGLTQADLFAADCNLRELATALGEANGLEAHDISMKVMFDAEKVNRDAEMARRAKTKGGTRKKRKDKERIQADLRHMKTLGQALCWFNLCPAASLPFSSSQNPTTPNNLESAYPDPVFVSIDLEWQENGDRALTEIGISTLDSRDLKLSPPGQHGVRWRSLIQSHHIRVAEYAHWRNKKYVQGCPDKFEWGHSVLVQESSIGYAIDRILNTDRNLILVGAGFGEDIARLQQANSAKFHVLAPPIGPNPPHLDTQELFRVMGHSEEVTGLGRALVALGEQPQHLHNAGNDARWTMHLLVRIVLDASEGWEEANNELVEYSPARCPPAPREVSEDRPVGSSSREVEEVRKWLEEVL